MLVLPVHARKIAFLKQHPRLTRISFFADANAEAGRTTAAQFWRRYEGTGTYAEALQAAMQQAGLDGKVESGFDGFPNVRLDRLEIKDLSFLKGFLVNRLTLANATLASLASLREADFREIDLSGTQVSDLAPLQGMPLVNVTLNGTPVRSLEPLRGMRPASLSLGLNRNADGKLTPDFGQRPPAAGGNARRPPRSGRDPSSRPRSLAQVPEPGAAGPPT